MYGSTIVMKEYIDKFIKDKLTPEELRRLREYVQTVSDEEFESLLCGIEEPQEGDMEICDESITRMKTVIDKQLDREGKKRRLKLLFTAVAAVACIAICVVSVLLFKGVLEQPQQLLSDNLMETVSTSGTGTTEVRLADGSIVSLCGMAKLSYKPSFEGDARRVEFSGRGYFKIHKDSLRPFEIATPEMTVRVLGTSFSIVSSSSTGYAELSLDEGSVMITSVKSHESVSITAGTTALINSEDGSIEVCYADVCGRIDWKSGELKFTNVSPDSLVLRLESVYGVKMSPESVSCINGNFTGSLPVDDYNTAMSILGKIYNFTPGASK